MPAKHDNVTFTPEERQALLALVSPGKAAASRLTRARILLQADHGPQGPAWSDAHSQQALHVGRKTVERTREPWVEGGLEAARQRNKRVRPGHQTCDGSKEAPLIAVACSKPPAGHTRWTLQRLADKMMELQHVEAMSPETIRQPLQKATLTRG